ncbi:MAG: ATP-binding protein [Candidatus Manganitrophus sp.]|nr:ATP-binding protein [Candidatus Manganitrophus sp.]
MEFYVKDNGIGIDPDYHDRIFGVFQRLKDLDVDGTGVGLTIVKKVVDLAHGKDLDRIEKRVKGATFFVRFPNGNRLRGSTIFHGLRIWISVINEFMIAYLRRRFDRSSFLGIIFLDKNQKLGNNNVHSSPSALPPESSSRSGGFLI